MTFHTFLAQTTSNEIINQKLQVYHIIYLDIGFAVFFMRKIHIVHITHKKNIDEKAIYILSYNFGSFCEISDIAVMNLFDDTNCITSLNSHKQILIAAKSCGL